jgi:hypothetical protein
MMLEKMLALSTLSPLKRARPKGLWQTRVTAASRFLTTVHDSPNGLRVDDSDTDNDELEDTQPSSKRRRYLSQDSEEDCWDYFPKHRLRSPSPELNRSPNRDTKAMEAATTARPNVQSSTRTSCDYEDWENLKELFARAAERYESPYRKFLISYNPNQLSLYL